MPYSPRLFTTAFVLIGLLLVTGCDLSKPKDSDGDGITDQYDSCPYQPGSPSNGGCPIQPQPELRISLWADKTVFSQGEPITLHISLNKDANVTLTNVYNDSACIRTTDTIFSQVLLSAGQHEYRAVAGALTGNRLLTATAVDSGGRVASASICITIGEAVLFLGPRCPNEPC